MQQRNYPKFFGLLGAGLGVIYMFYTVLAPYHKGPPVRIPYPMPPLDLAAIDAAASTGQPLAGLIAKLLVCGVIFALCGALVGTGIGLLVGGLLKKK